MSWSLGEKGSPPGYWSVRPLVFEQGRNTSVNIPLHLRHLHKNVSSNLVLLANIYCYLFAIIFQHLPYLGRWFGPGHHGECLYLDLAGMGMGGLYWLRPPTLSTLHNTASVPDRFEETKCMACSVILVYALKWSGKGRYIFLVSCPRAATCACTHVLRYIMYHNEYIKWKWRWPRPAHGRRQGGKEAVKTSLSHSPLTLTVAYKNTAVGPGCCTT